MENDTKRIKLLLRSRQVIHFVNCGWLFCFFPSPLFYSCIFEECIFLEQGRGEQSVCNMLSTGRGKQSPKYREVQAPPKGWQKDGRDSERSERYREKEKKKEVSANATESKTMKVSVFAFVSSSVCSLVICRPLKMKETFARRFCYSLKYVLYKEYQFCTPRRHTFCSPPPQINIFPKDLDTKQQP